MPYQLGLPNALARFGLRVEVIDGWGTRGGSSFNPRGSVSHWTANGSIADRPSLGVCINGHSTLPGPLCNVFLTRLGVAIVVAAGRANHAGIGGWRGLSGNSSVFGTEVEGSVGTVFGTNFTTAQLDAYPRVVAAYHWLMRNDPMVWACGHSEWTSRKIDVGGYAPTLRRQAAQLLAGGPSLTPIAPASTEGFLMALSDAQQTELLAEVRNIKSMIQVPGYPFGYPEASHNALAGLIAQVGGLQQQVGNLDPAQYADRTIEIVGKDVAKQVADELQKRLAS